MYNTELQGPPPSLVSLFRSRLAGRDSKTTEKGIDCCIVIGLNNNVGSRLYASIGEYLHRVHGTVARPRSDPDGGRSYEIKYVLNLGCDFAKGSLVAPYWVYGAVAGFGLRHVRIPRVVMAFMLWGERWFNAILCAASLYTSHCLIRLDKSPYWKDNVTVSHVISARFNFAASCWEI